MASLRRAFLAALFACFLLPSMAAAEAVLCWGRNNAGQCGGGFKTQSQTTPIGAPLPEGQVAKVFAGEGFSLALMKDGTVRATGHNDYGMLGDGTKINRTSWVQVKGVGGVGVLEHVVQIAPAGLHVTYLLSTGQVVTVGGDLYGGLDDGYSAKGSERLEKARDVPYLTSLTGMVGVSGGGATAAAWNAAGQLFMWGEDTAGQLGIGVKTKEAGVSQTHIGPVAEVTGAGEGTHGAVFHALLQDGSVWGWGENHYGEIGDGTQISRLTPVPINLTGVAEISTAYDHTLFRTTEDVVYATGLDGQGQLGTSAPTCLNKARGPSASAPCQTSPVATYRGASQISAGWRFSTALSGGRILAWGANDSGQLGNGQVSRTATATPRAVLGLTTATSIAAGRYHSLSLTSGPLPPPLIEALPGPGSITVRWRTTAVNKWQIRTRPVTRPESKWGSIVELPSTASSYPVTQYCVAKVCVKLAPGQPYAVVVQQAKVTGSALSVSGTPL